MRVLFVGLGRSAVCWYRCVLPAMALDADWVGLAGSPPTMQMQTGLVGGASRMPDLLDYEIVVLQQPRGEGWMRQIKRLQSEGVKVLYEVDDYLHAVRKVEGHDYKEHFRPKDLRELEACMRLSDGIICSTQFIANRYRKFNPRTWVCENGIDLARYRLTRPPRPTVNIGWSGATGHQEAMRPWMTVVAQVMRERPKATFVSVGMNYAGALERHFPGRTLAIPFTLVDTYPSAMTMFDIAIAPAGKGQFYRGKSDLRWLEAAALGVPIVADPVTYPRIEHGVTGFHASTPDEARELLLELTKSAKLRTRIGEAAREYVVEHRCTEVTARQWLAVFEEVLAPVESPA